MKTIDKCNNQKCKSYNPKIKENPRLYNNNCSTWNLSDLNKACKKFISSNKTKNNKMKFISNENKTN
jgi:hypothetical protein